MRTLAQRWTTVALTFALVVTGTYVSTSLPAQAVTPADGLLLYPGGASGTLKNLAGAATPLAFPISTVAAFSPDGASIAWAETTCVDQACTTESTTVKVRDNEGNAATLAAVPGRVGHLAWSPDQAQVAVLADASDSLAGDIWRVPVDGTAPVKVLGSSDTLRVEVAGLDWSPAGDTIAFIGTVVLDGGFSAAQDTEQVFTVGAEGGAPTRYSEPLGECDFPSCLLQSFANPAFSPDGTAIAAFVSSSFESYEDGTRIEKEFVGTFSAGQAPTEVAVLQNLTDPDSWFVLGIRGPLWSADGTRLLYSRYVDPTESTTAAAVVPLAGGAPQAVADAGFVDWQPCPTGQCASWGAPPDDCTIRGTSGDDRLEGTTGADVICGFEGDDVLFGHEGNDVIRGGPGQDQLIGGPGADTLQGDSGPDSLRGDTGNDLISGGSGPDLVTYFTSSSPTTIDLAKQKVAAGAHGTDQLIGIEGAFGSTAKDVLIGSSSSNHLFGGPGSDTITGNGGTDSLVGNDGNDSLYGGAAGDLLQGLAGADLLNGGDAADACYDTVSGNTRRSCELGGEGDPPSTTGPGSGDPTGIIPVGTTTTTAGQAVPFALGGYVYYWYIGNNDYLTVYDAVATQSLASWVNTPSWESQICRFIRNTPAKGACSAAGALNAVSKYQMKWFLWNAKRNNGCAIGILDWGRHGVLQFKPRWKTRAATYARYNVAVPWVDPGDTTYVKTSNGSLGVRC
jgi:Ca2+-binding RTX toxin-like protein